MPWLQNSPWGGRSDPDERRLGPQSGMEVSSAPRPRGRPSSTALPSRPPPAVWGPKPPRVAAAAGDEGQPWAGGPGAVGGETGTGAEGQEGSEGCLGYTPEKSILKPLTRKAPLRE